MPVSKTVIWSCSEIFQSENKDTVVDNVPLRVTSKFIRNIKATNERKRTFLRFFNTHFLRTESLRQNVEHFSAEVDKQQRQRVSRHVSSGSTLNQSSEKLIAKQRKTNVTLLYILTSTKKSIVVEKYLNEKGIEFFNDDSC